MSKGLIIILSNVLVIIATAIVVVAVVFISTLLLFKFVVPESAFIGEGGIVGVYLPLWLSVLSLPFTPIASYLLSMRLARYLNQNHNWQIEHPGRLFLLAVLIVFLMIPLLLLITASVSVS